MKIGIVGAAGNLGQSLTKLIIKNGYQDNLMLSDKKFSMHSSEISETIRNSEILFICVKPNDMHSLLKEFKNIKDKLIISCVAAFPIKEMEKYIDQSCQIVRIMTNLPICYGKGTITSYSKSNLKIDYLNILKNSLSGPKILKVKEEKLIDVSTVLTGCLPAFISLLSEPYMIFGMNSGFTKKETLDLYTETVEGTLEMIRKNSTQEIIKNVSSPGGVTEKGIKHLDENFIQTTIRDSLDICLNSIISKKI